VSDVANWGQMDFQEPATFFMNRIIEFHHSILSVLSFVLITVFYTLIITNVHFPNKKREVCIREDGDYSQEHTHATALEIIWTIIPSLLLVVIAIPTFVGLYAFEKEYAVDIHNTYKIIGNQWYWSYENGAFFEDGEFECIEYPSYMVATDDLELGELRLLETDTSLQIPTEKRLRLIITSHDVIHSFAVPSLGIKLDAVPGRLNQISFIVKRAGVFYGQCSEICGVDHGFMPIKVIAYNPLYIA
jgi:cytochrome c oxidase subunit 2